METLGSGQRLLRSHRRGRTGYALVALAGAALVFSTATESFGQTDRRRGGGTRRCRRAPGGVDASGSVIRSRSHDLPKVLPGVETAATSISVPLQGGFGFGFIIEGRPLDGPAHGGGSFTPISQGYFQVFKIPLLRGRDLSDRDIGGAPGVVIINEAMARRYWPDREAVGRDFRLRFDGDPWRVIGVVADYRVNTPGESPKAYIHLPFRRNDSFANYLVKTRVPAGTLVPTLERACETAGVALHDVDAIAVTAGPGLAGALLVGVASAKALALSLGKPVASAFPASPSAMAFRQLAEEMLSWASAEAQAADDNEPSRVMVSS